MKKNILITKRDRELMRWINAVGFATIEQIAKKLEIANVTAYGRMKKLVRHEYLQHERLYFGVPGVYSVKEKGVMCSGSHLPAIRMLSKLTYDHDLLVTQLILQLSKKIGGEITTERELRYQKAQNGIGQFGHIADAEIIVDNKKIAIEVELNQKGSRRFQKIMNDYMKNFDINEVWYFCANNQIMRQVMEYQTSCSFLKVFDLNGYLQR